MKINYSKHIWEGWTVQTFIIELTPLFNQIQKGAILAQAIYLERGIKKVVYGKSAVLQKIYSRCSGTFLKIV